MNHQVDSFGAGLAAVVSAVFSFIFDIPAPAVFAAFIGSLMAVAMMDAVTYKRAGWMILGGTFASGLLTSFVVLVTGWIVFKITGHEIDPETIPLRGLAALLAWCLVYFRDDIIGAVKRRINQ